MIDLSRRSAVVTGASGNLGGTVVRRLLDQGAHVAVAVRSVAQGDALRATLNGAVTAPTAPRLLVIQADLGVTGEMEALVTSVLRAWGRLDILVNAAGGFAPGGAAEPDFLAYRALWEQNVATAVTATAACLRPMRARRRGRIVSVGALAALRGTAGATGYSMAKSALLRWTEALAAEVRDDGVTVNVVLPSTIDGRENRAAMPKADPTRWASPLEVANLILFLASDEASGITGASIPVTART